MTAIEAIQAGDLEALRAALAADPTQARACTDEGVPALRLAVYYGRSEMIAPLRSALPDLDIHTGAAIGEVVDGDIASYSSDGWTPLHLAAFFGHAAAAREFLRRGASVAARSRNPLANLPIHAAAAGRRAAVVELLIRAGSPVNETQHGGFTPLHSAAQNGDEASVRLLLAAGADPRAAAGAGKTPLDLAREKGFETLALMLER